jgi:hypothetical protein
MQTNCYGLKAPLCMFFLSQLTTCKLLKLYQWFFEREKLLLPSYPLLIAMMMMKFLVYKFFPLFSVLLLPCTTSGRHNGVNDKAK